MAGFEGCRERESRRQAVDKERSLSFHSPGTYQTVDVNSEFAAVQRQLRDLQLETARRSSSSRVRAGSGEDAEDPNRTPKAKTTPEHVQPVYETCQEFVQSLAIV